MSTVYVGFSKRRGFSPLSSMIMWLEGTKFSHAYIRIRSDSIDRDLIYQATGAGVYFIGKALFEEHSETVEEYPLDMSDDARTRMLQWSVDNAGKPYGKRQMVGLGLVLLARMVGVRVKNPFTNGNKAYVCCELVAEALKNLGVPGADQIDQVDLNAARDMILSVSAVRG